MSLDVSSGTKFLIFKVADHHCAVPLHEVREVVLMAALTLPLAHSQAIEGILNLGGEVIPVLKLNRLLGLNDWEAGLYSHIILTKSGEQTLGFLTQSAYKIASFTTQKVKALTGQASWDGCATALIEDAEGFVHILSFAQVMKRFQNLIENEKAYSDPSMKVAV